MKTTLLLALLLGSFNSIAQEIIVDGAERISVVTEPPKVDESTEAQKSLDDLVYRIGILESGKSVRFLKNPCEGIRGYRFSRVRGFAFENGFIKKFQTNGLISGEKNKYSSMADFLRKRKLCEPYSKKLPSLNISVNQLDFYY